MADRAQAEVRATVQHGVVVMFDQGRGYGFIRPNGGLGQGNIFVHIHNVTNARTLHPGQHVSYQLTRTDRGPAAVSVRAGSVVGIPTVGYPLLGLLTAILLVGVGVLLWRPAALAGWLALWVAALSITTFAIYRFDKASAGAGGQRVPELALLLLAALGGSAGALAGMHLLPRHKTAKRGFQALFWLIVAVQVGVALFLVLK